MSRTAAHEADHRTFSDDELAAALEGSWGLPLSAPVAPVSTGAAATGPAPAELAAPVAAPEPQDAAPAEDLTGNADPVDEGTPAGPEGWVDEPVRLVKAADSHVHPMAYYPDAPVAAPAVEQQGPPLEVAHVGAVDTPDLHPSADAMPDSYADDAGTFTEEQSIEAAPEPDWATGELTDTPAAPAAVEPDDSTDSVTRANAALDDSAEYPPVPDLGWWPTVLPAAAPVPSHGDAPEAAEAPEAPEAAEQQSLDFDAWTPVSAPQVSLAEDPAAAGGDESSADHGAFVVGFEASPVEEAAPFAVIPITSPVEDIPAVVLAEHLGDTDLDTFLASFQTAPSELPTAVEGESVPAGIETVPLEATPHFAWTAADAALAEGSEDTETQADGGDLDLDMFRDDVESAPASMPVTHDDTPDTDVVAEFAPAPIPSTDEDTTTTDIEDRAPDAFLAGFGTASASVPVELAAAPETDVVAEFTPAPLPSPDEDITAADTDVVAEFTPAPLPSTDEDTTAVATDEDLEDRDLDAFLAGFETAAVSAPVAHDDTPETDVVAEFTPAPFLSTDEDITAADTDEDLADLEDLEDHDLDAFLAGFETAPTAALFYGVDEGTGAEGHVDDPDLDLFLAHFEDASVPAPAEPDDAVELADGSEILPAAAPLYVTDADTAAVDVDPVVNTSPQDPDLDAFLTGFEAAPVTTPTLQEATPAPDTLDAPAPDAPAAIDTADAPDALDAPTPDAALDADLPGLEETDVQAPLHDDQPADDATVNDSFDQSDVDPLSLVDLDDPSLRPRFAVAPKAVKLAAVVMWIGGLIWMLGAAMGLSITITGAGIPGIPAGIPDSAYWVMVAGATLEAVLLILAASGISRGVRSWWRVSFLTWLALVPLLPLALIAFPALVARSTREWVL